MAERWQQWYPHNIDPWQGSADVQALSDLAYRAVHNLLQDMWKQVDCALPQDDKELAKRSRVAARWADCKEEVLDYFRDRTEDGRITHRFLLKEWEAAREKYHENHKARVEAGKKGAAKRWDSSAIAEPCLSYSSAIAQPCESYSKPIANDSNNTVTVTSTETSTTKPLASTAVAVPADRGKLLGTILLNRGEYEVREDDLARDGPLYPGVDVLWQYRAMKAWSLANPAKRKTRKGIARFMNQWLDKAQNQPHLSGGSNGTNRQSLGNAVADRADEALARAKANILSRAGFCGDGSRPGDVSEPGSVDGPGATGVVLEGFV